MDTSRVSAWAKTAKYSMPHKCALPFWAKSKCIEQCSLSVEVVELDFYFKPCLHLKSREYKSAISVVAGMASFPNSGIFQTIDRRHMPLCVIRPPPICNQSDIELDGIVLVGVPTRSKSLEKSKEILMRALLCSSWLHHRMCASWGFALSSSIDNSLASEFL